MNNQLGSIPPSIWGHSGWKFLFSMAYVYPEDRPDTITRQNYYLYLIHLKNMLPCEKCRQHYAEYLDNKPLQFYLQNRESLFYWLLGLHNKSNRDTTIPNSQEAIARYLPRINAIQQQEQQEQQEQQRQQEQQHNKKRQEHPHQQNNKRPNNKREQRPGSQSLLGTIANCKSCLPN